MDIGSLVENGPEILLRYARDSNEEYGDKFEKFNKQLYQSFEKIARIILKQSCEGKQLPLAVFGVIIFMKNIKMRNDDFSCISFLDKFKQKSKQLAGLSKEVDIDAIQNFIRGKISSPTQIQQVFYSQKRLSFEVHELMNAIVGQKSTKQIKKYNEEQLNKIGSFFEQKVYLINYDQSKDALNNVPIVSNNVYVLKAKEMYFLLFKEKQIQRIEHGFMSHQELAAIFNVQNRLQKPIFKPLQSKSTIKDQSALNKSTSKKNITDLSGSRIKPSTLFPDQVTCVFCCKKFSQFSAIYWNYSHYCFECVLSPKKDISFIPSSIIQKFLKNKKLQNREYLLICSQCKADTIIPNYRPWDKPKYYKCKVCEKQICVQHEKMVSQCFCRCINCDKRTITISSIFIKYCLTCKSRFCQTCEKHSKKECGCICKNCGYNKKVDHDECKPRCHGCQAKNITLMDCSCNRKLCPNCFFKSMDPNSSTCAVMEVVSQSKVEIKA